MTRHSSPTALSRWKCNLASAAAEERIRLDPAKSIGKGGEADVYDIGGGKALKVFKPPGHPDYQNAPHEQAAARERIAEHQHKLPAYPNGLPSRVITPRELATSRFGREILGYSMMLLRGAEVLLRYAGKAFRQGGVDSNTVVSVFRDLHKTVSPLHKAQVVIGDFNDLNVLVKGSEAYLIDADSFQFERSCSHGEYDDIQGGAADSEFFPGFPEAHG